MTPIQTLEGGFKKTGQHITTDSFSWDIHALVFLLSNLEEKKKIVRNLTTRLVIIYLFLYVFLSFVLIKAFIRVTFKSR